MLHGNNVLIDGHIRREVILKAIPQLLAFPSNKSQVPSWVYSPSTVGHAAPPITASSQLTTKRNATNCLIILDAYWGKWPANIEKEYNQSSVLTSLLEAAVSSTFHGLPSPAPSCPIASQERLDLDSGWKPITKGRKETNQSFGRKMEHMCNNFPMCSKLKTNFQ